MRFNFFRGQETALVAVITFSFLLSAATATTASTTPVDSSSATALLLKFSQQVSDNAWQTVVAALARVDLSRLLGRQVVFAQRDRVAKGTEFLDVVQVVLSGDCAAGRNFDSTRRGPLGWVYLTGGTIQPFVFVDCSQIAKMLERELRNRPLSERGRILAHAISYVIAHELAHIVTQYPGHEETGLLKPHATKMDLLSGVPDIPKKDVLVLPKLAPCPTSKSREASLLEDDSW